MRVLHVIDSGGLYGAEIMLLNLAAEQQKLGIDSMIASIGDKKTSEKPLEAEARRRGLAVRTIRMMPGPNLAGALRIMKLARSEGISLLHSHGYKGNILLGFLPRGLRRMPLVVTVHGWTSTGKGLSRMFFYERLDRVSLKFADAVVLVNGEMRKHRGLRSLGAPPLHVIDNGVPSNGQLSTDRGVTRLERYENDIVRNLLSFCKDGFCIGAVGRLSKEKDYPTLIRAFHGLVTSSMPSARLVIIGEGPERCELENLVSKLGLAECVMLPGYLPAAKAFMPYFKVFVISSITEGLPIVLLEAMQAQIPVIATEVGGIPEVLQRGEAGVLVPPKSPKAIEDAISLLNEHPKLGNRLTECAMGLVKTRYSVETMAKRYLDIYEKSFQSHVNESIANSYSPVEKAHHA